MVSEVKNFEFVNHVQMAQEEKTFLFKHIFQIISGSRGINWKFTMENVWCKEVYEKDKLGSDN